MFIISETIVNRVWRLDMSSLVSFAVKIAEKHLGLDREN